MSELSDLRADIRAMRKDVTELLEVLGPTLPPIKTAMRSVFPYRVSDGAAVPAENDEAFGPFVRKVYRQIKEYDQCRLMLLGTSTHQQLSEQLYYFSLLPEDQARADAGRILHLAGRLHLLGEAEVWTFFEHPFRQPNVRTPCVPTLAAAQRAGLTE